MNTPALITMPLAGDTGEEEERRHIELEPVEVPLTVPEPEKVPV